MRKILAVLSISLGIGVTLIGETEAMPNFARKLEVDCAMCHTAVPKLNRYGYEFRSAGYRDPSDIGKDEGKFELGNMFAARIQSRFIYKKHQAVVASNNSNSNSFEFFEATLYPLTGSWGRHFGSLTELSMSPDDVFEIENAFVRGVWGSETKGWFYARLGVMHPWEGAGASDRPLGISRPLFQKMAATGSPFFLWNLDEAAAEAGYNFSKLGTTVSARISNGILWKEDGSGTAEPAQGGALSKPANQPGANDKNFQVFVNQFITGESSVAAYYYHGTIPYPDPNNPNTTKTTTDKFDRLAVYGNVWPMKGKLDLLAGYGYGHDALDDTTGISGAGNIGNSSGFFGEANYHATEKWAFGGRYDSFDPSNKVDHNNRTAETVFANYAFHNGLQFIGEYQHKDTEVTAGGKNKDDQVTVQMIYIW